MLKTIGFAALLVLLVSCSNNQASLSATQAADVKSAVLKMAASIAVRVTAEGPGAWLRYFEDSPNFFMVSDGVMSFTDSRSAKDFISNKLVKQHIKIKLEWSDMRIEPLTVNFAQVAASWHEAITDSSGNKITQHGYFTGLAHQTAEGWKLMNAHWSGVLPPSTK